jgi:hypothetical protein
MALLPTSSALLQMTTQLRDALDKKRAEYQAAQARIAEFVEREADIPEINQNTPLADAFKFIERKIIIRDLRLQAVQQVNFLRGLEPTDLTDVFKMILTARQRVSVPVEETFKQKIRTYCLSLESDSEALTAVERVIDNFESIYEYLDIVDSFLRDLPEQQNPVDHRYLASLRVFAVYDQVHALRSKLARAQERNDADAIEKLQAAVEERLKQVKHAFRELDGLKGETPE